MDQLKQAMAQAIRHQFWIIVGLAVLLGTVAWYMAGTNLNALYSEQERVIKGKFSDMEGVNSAANTHPNEASQIEMQRLIVSMSDDVQQAWEEQYQRQSEYLQWPDIGLPGLITKLQKYYPVELKLTFPAEPRDITQGEQIGFASYFDEQMPKLAKIIGVEWGGEDTGLGSGSSFGPGPGLSGGIGSANYSGGSLSTLGGTELSRDIVRWPKASQDELLSSLRLWPQGAKPSVYEMIYTQENIWILQGLLSIIAKTNIVPQTGRPATANIQAAIKEIEFIRIGRDAMGDAGDITMVAAAEATSGMSDGGMEGGMSSGTSGGMGGLQVDQSALAAATGSDVTGDAPVARDPATRRYVDRDFKPILGEDLRGKFTSEEPADAYFTVAKRVPVRMRLTIDLSRLQDFLANCGNEGLMFEVRQVRLGDTTAASPGASGSSGRMSMSGMGGLGLGGMDSSSSGRLGSGDLGMSSASSMSGGMGGPSGFGQGPQRRTNDMKLEVYGIVYLFYPPNIDRLGLHKVDESTQLTDTVGQVAEEQPQPAPAGPGDQATATVDDANAPAAPTGEQQPAQQPALDEPADGQPTEAPNS
ncbi:MAG: hypothetical protein KF752_08755 [Pirellulaceae bacterium]|nr:hypothetical protein [Pirellulaceae bacterium]